MKKYKVVPGPKIIEVKKGQVDAAFSDFQSLINSEANQGWAYHSMETITVSEKQGCFQPPVALNYYMLIFERDA